MRRTVLEDMTQPILMMTQQLHTLGERMVRYVGGDPGLALHRHREYPYYLYKSEYHTSLEYMLTHDCMTKFLMQTNGTFLQVLPRLTHSQHPQDKKAILPAWP